MSLIKDALQKAERDRAENARADAAHLTPRARAHKFRRHKEVQSIGLIVANAAVLLVGCAVIAFVVLRNRAPLSEEATSITASAAPEADLPAASTSSPMQPPTPGNLASGPSPFTPALQIDLAATPSSPDYELAGMSAMGATTLLSIVRRSDQRSVWIPVGKTVGEITAVSYDEQADRAVIRVRGRLLNIGLRSGPPPAPETQAAE